MRSIPTMMLALAVLSAGCSRAEERPTPAPLRAASADVRPPTANTAVPPEDRAIAKARKVWTTFDTLKGDQFRTLAMLQAHRLQADQGLEFLPDADAQRVRDFNGREFRKRVPSLLVPGEIGRTEGEANTLLVPSIDANRCTQLANTWKKSQQAELLASFGFTNMRCGAENWSLPASRK